VSVAWTSVQVNRDAIASEHRDSNNVGLSVFGPMGSFSGCEFVLADSGEEFGSRNRVLLVSGKRPHKSRDFVGRRYSLVFCTHTEAARLSQKDQEAVRTAGFGSAAPKDDHPRAALDSAEFARVGAHKNVFVRTMLLKEKRPERTARNAAGAIAFQDRLRPAPQLSQREADEREAAGGMRHPTRAVAKLPLAVLVGRKIRQALEVHLSANPPLES